jgi:hypothetical protein
MAKSFIAIAHFNDIRSYQEEMGFMAKAFSIPQSGASS